jgi:hypothetical protein
MKYIIFCVFVALFVAYITHYEIVLKIPNKIILKKGQHTFCFCTIFHLILKRIWAHATLFALHYWLLLHNALNHSQLISISSISS